LHNNLATFSVSKASRCGNMMKHYRVIFTGTPCAASKESEPWVKSCLASTDS